MKISIMEVGPRDGLQNVPELLTVDQKKGLIRFLLDQGLPDIEGGAFVRADKVPQMADTDQIAKHFESASPLWYLVPNLKGLETALSLQVRQIAFFTATSDQFNQKNIGMNTQESIDNISACIQFIKSKGYHVETDWEKPVLDSKKIKLRLYISTVIVSPYEGAISPSQTTKIINALLPLGISQVSLGDTIGVGVPADWKKLLREIDLFDSSLISKNRIAMHCHNTYGTALACAALGLEWGVQTFDSSVGGLGGCPFAPGASGNLATEDLIYFLERQGVQTGVNLESLLELFDPSRTGSLVNRSSVFLALGHRSRRHQSPQSDHPKS